MDRYIERYNYGFDGLGPSVGVRQVRGEEKKER